MIDPTAAPCIRVRQWIYDNCPDGADLTTKLVAENLGVKLSHASSAFTELRRRGIITPVSKAPQGTIVYKVSDVKGIELMAGNRRSPVVVHRPLGTGEGRRILDRAILPNQSDSAPTPTPAFLLSEELLELAIRSMNEGITKSLCIKLLELSLTAMRANHGSNT